MKSPRFAGQVTLALLALCLPARLSLAQNVGTFLVGKIHHFQQTSSATPLADATAPFQFGSLIMAGAATLNSATLTFSGTASPRSYTVDGAGDFFILDTFTTQAQLDAAYPTTSYTLNVNTTAGNFAKTIAMFPLSFPVVPRLTVSAADWQSNVLVIDPTIDYTLTWSFSNANIIDLIQLSIAGSGLNLTPFPASQNSYTIPAGTLQAGQTYASDLAFLRVVGTTAADANFGAGYAALARDTSFTIRTLAPAFTFAGAVSRKTHGAAGPFDIPLPTGTTMTESRTGGANGDHTLVFTFGNDIASSSAAVTAGTATISGSPTITGNTVTVNLTAVPNAQVVMVTLSQISDVFMQMLPDTSVNVGFLLGDSNGDTVVNGGDALQTRSRAGQLTDATNARSDANTDGVVNSGDVTVVRARSGTSLPGAGPGPAQAPRD